MPVSDLDAPIALIQDHRGDKGSSVASQGSAEPVDIERLTVKVSINFINRTQNIPLEKQ